MAQSEASQLPPTCACSHALFGSMPFSSRFKNGCVLTSAPHLCHQSQAASMHVRCGLRQVMQAGLRSEILRTHAACRTATPLGTPRR